MMQSRSVDSLVRTTIRWGDDSEYTMRISKYYAPAYFVGASVALHKRFNAKKLDIMMENDTKRLEMFRKYYRNTTINEGLFVSQKQEKNWSFTILRLRFRSCLKVTLSGLK